MDKNDMREVWPNCEPPSANFEVGLVRQCLLAALNNIDGGHEVIDKDGIRYVVIRDTTQYDKDGNFVYEVN
jgi:hypothetical protein